MAKLRRKARLRGLVSTLCYGGYCGFCALGCAKIVGLQTDVHPYSTPSGLGGEPGVMAGSGGGGSPDQPQSAQPGDAGAGGVTAGSADTCGSCPKGKLCAVRVGNEAAGVTLTCEPLNCVNQRTDADESNQNCGSVDSSCGRCDQAPFRVLRAMPSALPLVGYRRGSGLWYMADFIGTPELHNAQPPGDVPVIGDFNGDQILDYATYRIAEGWWSLLDGKDWS